MSEPVRPESLRCPNCQGPLSAPSGASQVRCDYCNHVARLRKTVAPHQAPRAPIQMEVAYDATRRVRGIVGAVVVAMVLLIGGVVALVVMKAANRASEPSRQAQQAIDRAADLQREALDRVERIQRDALDQADRALDQAAAARQRAERRAGKRRGKNKRRAEAADPGVKPARRRNKKARPPEPNLPATPDLATVKRKLRAIDVSHCPGDFAVTFGVRIKPDGTVSSPSVGPLRTRNGGTIACPRRALQAVRFAKSREGLQLKHELRGGALK